MAEVLISRADIPSPPPTLPFPRKLTPGSPVSLCLSLRAVTGDVWVPSDVLGVQGPEQPEWHCLLAFGTHGHAVKGGVWQW